MELICSVVVQCLYKNQVDLLINFKSWFDVPTITFEKISEDFHVLFKKAKLQPVIYSIVDKNLNKIKCEILPYCVFCLLFHCVRGSQPSSRCQSCNLQVDASQSCTRFFVDDEVCAAEIKNEFHFYLNKNTSSSLNKMYEEWNRTRYFLDLHCIVSDIVRASCNKDYGCLFF